jgi:hypothetical protein
VESSRDVSPTGRMSLKKRRGGFTSLALGGATLGICLVTKCLCPHLCPTSTRSERKIHHQRALHSPTNWACVRQFRRYSSGQTTHSLPFQPNYATTILIPRGIRKRPAYYLHSQKRLKISLRLFAKLDPGGVTGGFKFVTPAKRHCGQADAILRRHEQVHEAAKQRWPERWFGATRNWKLKDEVWLNPERATPEFLKLAA